MRCVTALVFGMRIFNVIWLNFADYENSIFVKLEAEVLLKVLGISL